MSSRFGRQPPNHSLNRKTPAGGACAPRQFGSCRVFRLAQTLDSNTPPIPAPIHFILNGTHRVPLNAINSVSVALGSIPLMEKPHQNVGRHVSQVSSCAFWKFHNLAHLGILAV